MAIHVRDDFQSGAPVSQVPASWFNNVGKFINGLIPGEGIEFDRHGENVTAISVSGDLVKIADDATASAFLALGDNSTLVTPEDQPAVVDADAALTAGELVLGSGTTLSSSGITVEDVLTVDVAADTYLKKSDASDTYLTQTDASNTYLTISAASDTYATKSQLSALTAVVQSITVPSDYLTSSDLAGYAKTSDLGDAATKNVGTGSNDVAAGDHTHSVSDISDSNCTSKCFIVGTGSNGKFEHSNSGLNGADYYGGDWPVLRQLVNETFSYTSTSGIYKLKASKITSDSLTKSAFVAISSGGDLCTPTQQPATVASGGSLSSGYVLQGGGNRVVSSSGVQVSQIVKKSDAGTLFLSPTAVQTMIASVGSGHTHTTSQIEGFDSHTHSKSQITDFNDHTHTTDQITGFDSHTHTSADITDMDFGEAAEMDIGTTEGTVAEGKHTHAAEDIVGTGCTADCVAIFKSIDGSRKLAHSEKSLNGANLVQGDWPVLQKIANAFNFVSTDGVYEARVKVANLDGSDLKDSTNDVFIAVDKDGNVTVPTADNQPIVSNPGDPSDTTDIASGDGGYESADSTTSTFSGKQTSGGTTETKGYTILLPCRAYTDESSANVVFFWRKFTLTCDGRIRSIGREEATTMAVAFG